MENLKKLIGVVFYTYTGSLEGEKLSAQKTTETEYN